MGMMLIYRRYLHRMRMNARACGDGELESVWQYKQEAQPGTALPASFPFLAVLADAGYTTQEDLLGADVLELTRIAKLWPTDAEVVLRARDALPPITP